MSKLKKKDFSFPEYPSLPEDEDYEPETIKVKVIIRGELCGEYIYWIYDEFKMEKFDIDNKRTYYVKIFEPKKYENVKGSGTMTMQHIIDEAKRLECYHVAGHVQNRARDFFERFSYNDKKFIKINGHYRWDC